ncbi:MAG: SDR family NAD(P)-dependent oxidoreductase [Saprospiraceae bacterium]|nr:SDR family NAD(P)-dependent oxidoreductase [Saprospiraceae bacterium]
MNALITGSSKGIGRAIAFQMASKGHNLALCAREEQGLIKLKNEIEFEFKDVDVYISSVDMRKPDDIARFADEIHEHLGTVDILVNNAGVFIPGQVCNENPGTLELMIETNLYSAYHMTRAVLGNMIQQGRGHIFNMCSVASILAYPNGGSYSISKFALLGFSKVLREELKTSGIKVTAVMPGATWSDSWSGVDLPESRLMRADDIAKAIVNATEMSPSAVVEEIIMRPQLGDL